MLHREMRGRNYGNCEQPCLTMHQPWASLLVHGIKRVEGRSWPAPIRGRLWIHAASKVPDMATIEAMERFYREIYAQDGITDLKFPEHYPVSRLIGCVEVTGCLRGEELASWEEVPEGVRLEVLTNFCWLCENPQKLLVPIEMKGNQGVYELERKIFEAAARGLVLVGSPLPVKFLLPNLHDPFSLKPGSILAKYPASKASELERSSNLSVAIAGARAAATQFSRKVPNFQTNNIEFRKMPASGQSKNKILEEDKMLVGDLVGKSNKLVVAFNNHGQSSHAEYGEHGSCNNEISRMDLRWQPKFGGYGRSHSQISSVESNQHPAAPSRIFAAAVRGLRP